jgi:hypothetical protein
MCGHSQMAKLLYPRVYMVMCMCTNLGFTMMRYSLIHHLELLRRHTIKLERSKGPLDEVEKVSPNRDSFI